MRAQEAEQLAEEEYRASVDRLAVVHEEWREGMLLCAREFQKTEETRLDISKRALVEYHAFIESAWQEEAFSSASARERALFCDRLIEMREFVRVYGTGTTIPQAPVYDGLLDESLDQLLLDDDADKRSRVAGVGGLARPVESPLSFSEDSRSDHLPRKSKSPIPIATETLAGELRRGSGASLGSSNNSFSQTSFQTSGLTATVTASVKFRVQTLYAYEAQETDELSFGADQFISVLSTEEDPWWHGQVEGTLSSGLFPSNYVQRV